MTLVLLGIVIVLLQSYVRLNNRHQNLIDEHIYAMETMLQDIEQIKNKCTREIKPE